MTIKEIPINIDKIIEQINSSIVILGDLNTFLLGHAINKLSEAKTSLEKYIELTEA